jgi:hypothetical protein
MEAAGESIHTDRIMEIIESHAPLTAEMRELLRAAFNSNLVKMHGVQLVR